MKFHIVATVKELQHFKTVEVLALNTNINAIWRASEASETEQIQAAVGVYTYIYIGT